MSNVILEENAELQKGNYVITYKVSLFADLISWLLEQIRPALNVVTNLTEYKKLRIDKFDTETKEEQVYLKVYFSVLGDSPAVPLSVILVVLGFLLIAVAVFLTFDKFEQILEPPTGKALSFGFVIFAILGIFTLYNFQKRKK